MSTRYRQVLFWALMIVSVILGVCDASISDPVVTSQDPRDSFEASAYAGIGVDSFAVGTLKTYLNPNASSDIETRFVAGFDFDYRLTGDPNGGKQLWILGETVHGVRSADVDCKSNPQLSVCEPFNPETLGETTLYILRNATSLEGYLGLRWEFFQIHPDDPNSARAYVKAQIGFVSVSNSGGDVLNNDVLAVGLIAVKGRFCSSYVDIGYGKSDFFLTNQNKRLKIDGYLTWAFTDHKKVFPFAQITVDSDFFGNGADSIQTYYGLTFDLDELFKKGNSGNKPKGSSGAK